ncbi:hypothetical protein Tco_1328144 [Tanacetum coccineum]
METQKPLLKDEDGEEVDVHMYRSMIGSLMYLTSSRPDIMFAVCACARYQVNPKVSHLYAVKRIFRYLKGQPKLGLWYLKDSSFDLVAYTNSDYAGASLDRKSTTGEKAKKSVRLMMEKLVIRENRQRVLVSKRIERVGENKNRKRAVWNKNRQSDLVSKRIERICELKNRKRVEYIKNRQSVWTGIGVNAGNSKLMLLGINLILLVKVNAARHNLLLLVKVNAARHNLLLLGYYCWAKVNAVEAQIANLKFADTHNMVAFLSKLAESEGFEQIVDFLNANPIRYALTINPTIYTSCIKQFWAIVKVKTINGEVQLQALVDEKKIIITKSTVRRDLQLEDAKGVDCLPNATIFEQLLLMGYEQDNGTSIKTALKATPNEAGSQGTTSGGGPRRQETMGDTIAQTRFENVSKLSNDPLLARGNTLRSGEDSLKLNELMELCTNLQTRVLDLEKTKTTQAEEIVSLKRRVKKLEQKKRSRTHGLKRLYKVGLTARVESSGDEEDLGEDASKQGRRIHDIDADEDITLVNDQDDADMFDVNTLTGDEVLAEPEVVVKDVNLTVDEVTLAQALAALKSVKPKVKANVVEEPSVPVSAASTKVSAATTTTTATIPTPRKGIVITELGTSTTTTTISSQPSQAKVQDKGKGIMVEEPVKSMKKKDLVRLDEEIASKLQAEFDEEERLAREKDEANVALTEEWDDIQAKVDADYQLAQRLQAEEQEQFTTKQKATLFKELLEQRRKHFAAKRAEKKRNKPPTQAQQRKIMCTYLKNMEGKKPKDLKNKSFDSIQKIFDKAFKRVNIFVDFRTDLVEGSSKRAGTELEQEVTKKQKIDDVQEIAEVDNDQEAAKINELMKIIPNKEEVAEDTVWRNQQDYRVLE